MDKLKILNESDHANQPTFMIDAGQSEKINELIDIIIYLKSRIASLEKKHNYAPTFNPSIETVNP